MKKTMKNYLVTGATGFVACHFFEYLNSLQEECKVLGIDIKAPTDDVKFDNFPYLQLRFAEIDLLDYSALESLLLSFLPTHIIHLASFSSVSESWNKPVKSFLNNTNIFLNIAEIIRTNNIACRFLSVGSSEEYGNVPASCIPIKETVQLKPISPYAIARVSQEMLSQCYVSSYGLDIVLTRSFNHIGPGQRANFVIPSFIKQILENIKTGNTSCIKLSTGNVSLTRDFLDVRDVVKAYYLLLEKGAPGELYNICSGKGRSIKEIIDMLSCLFNIQILIEVDKNKIRPNDNKIIIGDNSKIISQIDWHPQIPFEDSLRDVIAFWKKVLNMENCL
ncbi:MAG: GDP-mannose 4,6-dehydratase [Treponema sp.]|nr:GDP-mannose 4,6-dehydratase [Treponema sp.]